MQNSKLKHQNEKIKCKKHPQRGYHNFDFCNLIFDFHRGITLLLVILVLSALMTVSLGIFNVAFSELRISGEMTNSFRALYAADQFMEAALYKARVAQSVCGVQSPDPNTPCYVLCSASYACPSGIVSDVLSADISSGACSASSDGSCLQGARSCAAATVTKFAGATTVTSIGQFDCISGSAKVVKRAVQVDY